MFGLKIFHTPTSNARIKANDGLIKAEKATPKVRITANKNHNFHNLFLLNLINRRRSKVPTMIEETIYHTAFVSSTGGRSIP